MVSDAHLFQTFSEAYDSVADFKRAIVQVAKDANPDAIFLAGDMFDYKKTETMYVRHYEGEGYMMRVREVLKEFGKPIYAIRGNHDKAEILKGLSQTVPNFHYKGNCIEPIGDMGICFMDSYYETGGIYESTTIDAMKSFLQESATKLRGQSTKKLLLCHETLEPYENAIPQDVVRIMMSDFSLVLNGHMHFWNPRTYASSSMVCLPSLLPSKIEKGKYAMERCHWSSSETNYEITKLESPFGYTILDTDTLKVDAHPFEPSKRIIEVVIGTTGLSLEEARKRYRLILTGLQNRNDKNSLIVLPCLEGAVSFAPVYLNSVKNGFPELFVEDLRFAAATLVTTLGSVSLEAPTLSIEQLLEKLNANVPKLAQAISSKGVSIDEATIRKTLDILLDEELLAKSQTIAQNRARLQMVLTPIIEVLGESTGKGQPSNLQDNLTTLLKVMR